jgi:hypothetical protein
MSLLTSALLLSAGATSSISSCRAGSVEDCNGGGVCDESGACQCSIGFRGSHCELLAFGESMPCGQGGLCMPNASTWGANAILGEDGLYHMFGTLISEGCRLVESGGGWLTNSVVLHATSAAPAGNYAPAKLALNPNESASWWDGLSNHNPAPFRAPDGTWLIFYMGTNGKGNHSDYCGGSGGGGRADVVGVGARSGLSPLALNQHVGLAYSSSPEGPWRRLPSPIIATPQVPAWYELFTSNPSAVVHPNGSVVLLFKGRARNNATLMNTGVATAPHWRGPYTVSPLGPIPVDGHCEDAGMYYSRQAGTYRAVFHCECNAQFAWSRDGLHWQVTTPQQPWCEPQWAGGGAGGKLARRERPQWLLGKDGEPTHMVNGVRSADTGVHDGRTWTMITAVA